MADVPELSSEGSNSLSIAVSSVIPSCALEFFVFEQNFSIEFLVSAIGNGDSPPV